MQAIALMLLNIQAPALVQVYHLPQLPLRVLLVEHKLLLNTVLLNNIRESL